MRVIRRRHPVGKSSTLLGLNRLLNSDPPDRDARTITIKNDEIAAVYQI
jgi:hypothetical protein